MIGARIVRGTQGAYRLSYQVLKKSTQSGSYIVVEKSQVWGIPADVESRGGVFIGPDFPGGASSGQYEFAVYIDDRLVKTINFELKASAP